MTAEEERRVNANIEKLAEEMRASFHKVHQDIATLNSDHKLVAKHELDLHGIPGDDTKKGGVRNQDSLIQSRKFLRVGLGMLWAAILASVGVITFLVKRALGY